MKNNVPQVFSTGHANYVHFLRIYIKDSYEANKTKKRMLV